MFKEFYYWMYFYLSKVKTNKTPAFNAYVLISVLFTFNIETLFFILDYNLKLNGKTFNAYFVGGGLSVLLYIVNYLLLFKKRNQIFEKYNNIQPRRRVIGKICYWIYVVLTFSILFTTIKLLGTDPNKIQKNNLEVNGSIGISQRTFILNVHEVIDGWLKENQTQNVIIDSLGSPENNGVEYYLSSRKEYLQKWEYSSKGLILEMVSNRRGGEKKVQSITVTEPCKLSTSQGFGIGASGKDVREKYSDLIDEKNSSVEKIVVGSIYGGTVFTLKNEIVSKIFIGAEAE